MQTVPFLPQLVSQGFDEDDVFDINVIVLVHYAGSYKRRFTFFKKYGLANLHKVQAHISLVCSKGDGAHAAEITSGWPESARISIFESTSNDPLPKTNGLYLWLSTSSLKAKWHLRVDDDSWSDLEGIVRYANTNFEDLPVHLMTPPIHHDEHMHEVLRHLNISIAPIHEHECSLTSDRAMKILFENAKALEFLIYTGLNYAAPGDLCLGWSMQICRVPAYTCNAFSKHFERTKITVIGGTLLHIHYVNWDDDSFVVMLDGIMYGQRKLIGIDRLNGVIGKPMAFGRCVGHFLNELVLEPDGSITGNHDENESFWKFSDNCLIFYSGTQTVTTVFTTEICTSDRVWLVGKYVHNSDVHYLRAIQAPAN